MEQYTKEAPSFQQNGNAAPEHEKSQIVPDATQTKKGGWRAAFSKQRMQSTQTWTYTDDFAPQIGHLSGGEPSSI